MFIVLPLPLATLAAPRNLPRPSPPPSPNATSLSQRHLSLRAVIPGTCVQYPGLQGGGALGDASTPGTPAGSMAANTHGGTYSHVAGAGERGAGKRVPPPPPQRLRPAGVAQRPRAGPSPRCAAHLRTKGGAADTAHVRAGGVDRRATGRL